KAARAQRGPMLSVRAKEAISSVVSSIGGLVPPQVRDFFDRAQESISRAWLASSEKSALKSYDRAKQAREAAEVKLEQAVKKAREMDDAPFRTRDDLARARIAQREAKSQFQFADSQFERADRALSRMQESGKKQWGSYTLEQAKAEVKAAKAT